MNGPLPNCGDREYFRKMLDSGVLVIDLPLIGRASRKAALPIAGPLQDEQGEMVGALLLSPDLTVFGERFLREHPIPGLVFQLWDRNGKVIFRHPDIEQLTDMQFPNLPLVRLKGKRGGRGIIETKGFDGIDRVVGCSAPEGEYASTGIYKVARSWFNRFRKLLVRYEKLDRSFLALNHLAASVMTFRKIKLDANIIYG